MFVNGRRGGFCAFSPYGANALLTRHASVAGKPSGLKVSSAACYQVTRHCRMYSPCVEKLQRELPAQLQERSRLPPGSIAASTEG